MNEGFYLSWENTLGNLSNARDVLRKIILQ